MNLKSDAKFEEKLTYGSENDMRNLANFHQSTWKYQNWDFDWILLSKVENAWAKKLQRNYMYWHWRMIENLTGNWIAVSKLTWRIWRIFTQVLKSLKYLHFNGHLLTKVYNVWTKKVQRSYLSWHRRVMQNWRETDLWFGKFSKVEK